MLAMDGIDIVHQEGAVGAFEANLVRPEDRLEQPQEKTDADDHDDHREEPTARPLQRDVAEARGRERRDREIERVDIARDLRVEWCWVT